MKAKDKKAKFRASKEWKEFRKLMIQKQNGKDYITGRKLLPRSQVHHMDLNPDNYENLDPDNFIVIGKTWHDTIHFLYNQIKKDPECIDKLFKILDKMREIND